ncbi:hypothetical protein [Novosphingobium sp.]|uniref:hypothetical protein n=1 Tax=Novosphingobium sp. TaxID=1874826 RepID=UPI003B51BF61
MNFPAWVIPLSLVASSAGAAAAPQTMHYCLSENIDAGGGGGSFPPGRFVMKATLAVSGSHYVLDAWNVMPDNPQVLEIHADGTYRRKGATPIRFIDNFGNRGRGTFSAGKATFHIDIDRVGTSDGGANIGRNYGTYDLKSRGCRWSQP